MERKRFRKVLRRAVWIPSGTALVLAAVLILVLQIVTRQQEWVVHTDQVITIAQHLYRLRIDEETGLRAYLLTRDERFLQPFTESGDQAPKFEAQLGQLIAGNPEQRLQNEKVYAAHRAWHAWAVRAITMAKTGAPAGDLEFQLRGKELMDRYRETRTEFIAREEQLRDHRLAMSRSTVRDANAIIVVLCLVVGGLLAAFGHKQMVSLSQSFNAAFERAEASKARVTGIIDSAMDAIVTMDEAQHILVFNRAAENIFRCPASEALGQRVDKFIPGLFRQVDLRHVEDFGKTGVTGRSMFHSSILSGLRKDGEEFPVEASISQMESHSEKLFTVILRDITERKMSEEALRRAEKVFRNVSAGEGRSRVHAPRRFGRYPGRRPRVRDHRRARLVAGLAPAQRVFRHRHMGGRVGVRTGSRDARGPDRRGRRDTRGAHRAEARLHKAPAGSVHAGGPMIEVHEQRATAGPTSASASRTRPLRSCTRAATLAP